MPIAENWPTGVLALLGSLVVENETLKQALKEEAQRGQKQDAVPAQDGSQGQVPEVRKDGVSL